LDPEAMERVYRTVADYSARIEKAGVDRKLAIFTSAVRDAADGKKFARSIEERFGLTPYVLSGEQEAQLTFFGATSERDRADTTPTLVIDIGGGSTELVIGAGHEPDFHVSTQAGVVRQTERHLHDDPPTRQPLADLHNDVRDELERAVPPPQRQSIEQAIAVAGTATSLGAIAQSLEPYDPEKVQGYVLRKDEIESIYERLAAVPLERRRQIPGLHPDRAPTIIAGVVILLEVLKLFGLTRVEVSEHDILRGAVLGLGAG
jgi:exopolyphosphatase/guanosine-5'-triphosphate,3'-diphosphate pyrophosphatase